MHSRFVSFRIKLEIVRRKFTLTLSPCSYMTTEGQTLQWQAHKHFCFDANRRSVALQNGLDLVLLYQTLGITDPQYTHGQTFPLDC